MGNVGNSVFRKTRSQAKQPPFIQAGRYVRSTDTRSFASVSRIFACQTLREGVRDQCTRLCRMARVQSPRQSARMKQRYACRYNYEVEFVQTSDPDGTFNLRVGNIHRATVLS